MSLPRIKKAEFFPLMVNAENAAASHDMESANAFVRRTRDGKFYRGATFWKWTRSWRRASMLPVHFWRQFVLHKIDSREEVEFVFLDQVE